MSSISKKELPSLLILNALMMGLTRQIYPLLENGMRPSEILNRIKGDNFLNRKSALIKRQAEFFPSDEIEKCEKLGIQLLPFCDPRFPRLLRCITDPPIVFYCKGEFSPADAVAVAVVGSRHASLYGRTQAQKFALKLAENGVTLVSGLALGVDQAAHEASLLVPGGRTVAVLGSGIDIVYPRQNKNLFERILTQGVIISEFPLGTRPHAMNFPRRNRIISGLSLGVLVVEAHERSGSLITAREALDQGREVFAVPGPVDSLTSKGTNRLIQDGASLVTDAENILDALAGMLPHFKPYLTEDAAPRDAAHHANNSGLNKSETKNPEECGEVSDPVERFLAQVLASEPLTYNELVSRSEFDAGKVALAVMNLEVRKKIKRLREGSLTWCGGQH